MTTRNKFFAATPAEQKMLSLIDAGIAAAADEGRVIDLDTARRIAACLHRGLGGELAQFAGTGRLSHIEAARLELHYATCGEPGMRTWHDALAGYLHAHPRPRGAAHHPSYLHPAAAPSDDGAHAPGAVLAYLRTGAGDQVDRPGLALQMQYDACRAYARRVLHRRLSGVFADRPGSHGTGIARLVAHLAIYHNGRVIVHRLDRLPPGGPAAHRIAALGARVLSVTEHHTRRLSAQTDLNTDIARLDSTTRARATCGTGDTTNHDKGTRHEQH